MAGRFANLEFQPPHEEPSREVEVNSAVESASQNCLTRAREAAAWERFEEALRLYTRALGEERGLVAAWVGQVQMLVQLDECHEARVWSGKALQLFRGHGDLLAAEAQAAVRLGDLKAAQKLSDAAMQAGDDSAWRWEARGELLLKQQKRTWDECFQKAVRHPAADWHAYVRVARTCEFHGQFASAIRYVNDAVGIAPQHAVPWFVLGECQRQLALGPAARTSFERALELAPRWLAPRRAVDALDAGIGVGAWVRGWFRRRRP